MLKGKVKNFFDVNGGNSGLVEEFIYLNQPKSEEDAVKVYSSSTKKNTALKSIDRETVIIKNNKKIKMKKYFGEGVIIARNGKAGTMVYVNDEMFTMNDHAYVLQVKPKFKEDVNIKYIIYSQRNAVERCVTSDKKGNRTFNKTLYLESYITIPDIAEQNKLIKEYEKLKRIQNKIETSVGKVDKLLNSSLKYDVGEEKSLSEIFFINQGHQITDEELYNTEGNIPVYTSDNFIKGYWDKTIITANELPCLTYATKAFSGIITIQTELFDANNTAILYPKPEYKHKVDLRYFKFILSNIFLELATSKNGVSYLNKEFVENVKFILPNKKTQSLIADNYEKLERYKSKLKEVHEKLEKILK